jgi:antirestriction protein ArdC
LTGAEMPLKINLLSNSKEAFKMYKNFLTGIEYTNSNWETLAESGFSNPNFLTFKQAQMAGLKIKKGSKGIELKRVVIKKEKDKNGVEVQKKLLKKFYVFNISQTEKL